MAELVTQARQDPLQLVGGNLRQGEPVTRCFLEQFTDRAHRLDGAVVQDGDAVAHVLDVGKQVGREQHGFAAVGQGADEIFDLATPDGVESGSWFVEDDQIRIVHQRLGEADAASHALGKLAHPAASGMAQTDHVEQLLDPLPPIDAVEIEQRAIELERLLGVEVRVEIRFLGDVPDPFLGFDVAG